MEVEPAGDKGPASFFFFFVEEESGIQSENAPKEIRRHGVPVQTLQSLGSKARTPRKRFGGTVSRFKLCRVWDPKRERPERDSEARCPGSNSAESGIQSENAPKEIRRHGVPVQTLQSLGSKARTPRKRFRGTVSRFKLCRVWDPKRERPERDSEARCPGSNSAESGIQSENAPKEIRRHGVPVQTLQSLGSKARTPRKRFGGTVSRFKLCRVWDPKRERPERDSEARGPGSNSAESGIQSENALKEIRRHGVPVQTLQSLGSKARTPRKRFGGTGSRFKLCRVWDPQRERPERDSEAQGPGSNSAESGIHSENGPKEIQRHGVPVQTLQSLGSKARTPRKRFRGTVSRFKLCRVWDPKRVVQWKRSTQEQGGQPHSLGYSFTWLSSQVHSNMLMHFTGQIVESFDRQFRCLYADSQIVDSLHDPDEDGIPCYSFGKRPPEFMQEKPKERVYSDPSSSCSSNSFSSIKKSPGMGSPAFKLNYKNAYLSPDKKAPSPGLYNPSNQGRKGSGSSGAVESSSDSQAFNPSALRNGGGAVSKISGLGLYETKQNYTPLNPSLGKEQRRPPYTEPEQPGKQKTAPLFSKLTNVLTPGAKEGFTKPPTRNNAAAVSHFKDLSLSESTKTNENKPGYPVVPAPLPADVLPAVRRGEISRNDVKRMTLGHSQLDLVNHYNKMKSKNIYSRFEVKDTPHM
ncbi:UNVERIFIED_CONTAM: hypothetical protein FKN15_069000 [Acipenser sinensis]